jgi:hypothetical protein
MYHYIVLCVDRARVSRAMGGSQAVVSVEAAREPLVRTRTEEGGSA